jgi:hypothetical protein
VLVVGAPFSGATTLAWALGQHPRLNPVVGSKPGETLSTVLRALDEEVLPLLGRRLDDPSGGGDEHADGTGALVASVLRAVARELQTAGRRASERWVAAGAEYVSQIPRVARFFPGLRLIHVLRDATSVNAQLVAAAVRDGNTISVEVAERIRLRAVEACVAGEALVACGRVLRIDYCDLVRDPVTTLRSCLAFVGERWTDECLWPLRLLVTGDPSPAESDAQAVTPASRRPPVRVLSRAGGTPAAAVGPAHRAFHRLVESVVPDGATVLVASRGDEALLGFRGRQGAHFPQLAGGVYAGHYPSDGRAAVAHVDALRVEGATHLAFPTSAFWWLDHYDELRRQLESTARLVACDLETALVWELDADGCLRLPESLVLRRRVPVEPANHRALTIDDLTPPPRRPTTLPGDLWAVTAYFNPAGYRTKSENYDRFRAGLATEGIPLLAVELAFDGDFELQHGDADLLVQLRGGDVLWQKERLLNIGIAALPDTCDKVAWLDGDVLFARRGWSEATRRLLDEHVVVQPFSHCVRLPAGATSCEPAALPFGGGESELFYGMAWGVRAKGRSSLARYEDHGHTGFAWAARRELLARHGLYDANLLGNGDTDVAHAMFGSSDYWGLRKLGAAARAHLARWATPFAAEVAGSVGHVDGVLTHLWHGSPQHRLYDRPLDVLRDFDPDRDLELDQGTGLYRWAGAAGELRAWSASYFHERREDGE